MFDRVVHLAHLNMDSFALGSQTWGQQFVEAMSVNGGDVKNATALDYVMHFCTFFWKVRDALKSNQSYLFFESILVAWYTHALV